MGPLVVEDPKTGYGKHEAPVPNERDEGDVTLQTDL
jgi:hypothetical protein